MPIAFCDKPSEEDVLLFDAALAEYGLENLVKDMNERLMNAAIAVDEFRESIVPKPETLASEFNR